MLSHMTPDRLLKYFGADIFTINNKHYFCTVDYHNKFPVIKQVEGLSTGYLVKICQIIITYDNGLQNKLISDLGESFISEKF